VLPLVQRHGGLFDEVRIRVEVGRVGDQYSHVLTMAGPPPSL
jgi:hypothetical protein